LDSANNRVLVADEILDALIAVDLSTGNRTVLSDDNDTNNSNIAVGRGPSFIAPSGLVLDSANNRVFVGDANSVIVVDMPTGDRAISSR